MKKIILFCFIVFVCFFGFSQARETPNIDSLKFEFIKPSISDTTKIVLCLNLAASYEQFNLDSIEKYSKLGHNISMSSTKYYLGRTYAQLGRYHLRYERMDSARYYFKKGIEIAEINADTTFQIDALRFYLLSLRDGTNFEEKVELNLKIIKLAELKNFRLAQSQYQLAALYGSAGFDKLAIKYFEEALQNIEKDNKYRVTIRANILTNLVFFELEKPNLDINKIESYLSQMSEACSISNSILLCHYFYAREGEYYDAVEQFNKAEISFNNSLHEAKKLNDPYTLMFAYVCLAEHFVHAKKPIKAIENFKIFKNLINDKSIPDMEVWAYEYWAKAEKMAGNFKNANIYLEKYVKLNDSINSKKNKAALTNSNAKYQTEKKDKIILEQKLVVSNQQLSIQKSKSKTQLMTILIISLLLASILLWFSFRQRQKRIQQQLISVQKEQEVRTLESLITGEEKERLRISQELHDGVNGDLSAIKFKLSSLLKMNNEVINEAVTMIDNSCKQVRAISHNLVPPSLKNFSLIEAINNYCENMNSIHKSEISFQHIGDPINLNKKVEVNIFRIIQEFVTNATKHAEASTIDAQISNRNNTLLITVEDNGKGYENKAEKQLGIGLDNIKSRVEYLNANFEVVTNKSGTYNTIEIDLSKLED